MQNRNDVAMNAAVAAIEKVAGPSNQTLTVLREIKMLYSMAASRLVEAENYVFDTRQALNKMADRLSHEIQRIESAIGLRKACVRCGLDVITRSSYHDFDRVKICDDCDHENEQEGA